jgi:hypothetical protein
MQEVMWRIFQMARTMKERAPRHILKRALFCVGVGAVGGKGRVGIIALSNVIQAHKNNNDVGIDTNLNIHEFFFFVCVAGDLRRDIELFPKCLCTDGC